MALSKEAKRRLVLAAVSEEIGAEIAAAIDAEADPLVPAAAVADIADTTTADAEEVAEKMNELLASLRAAGFLAT